MYWFNHNLNTTELLVYVITILKMRKLIILLMVEHLHGEMVYSGTDLLPQG